MPLSPGAAGDIPGASPGQDGDRLLMVVVVAAAAVGVFEDSAGVRLRRGLPGSGDGREVRVFPEGDAPAVAPGGGRVGPAEVGGVPGPLPAGDRGGVLPGPAAVVVTGGPGATARPEPLWRVGPGAGGGESQLGLGWARAGTTMISLYSPVSVGLSVRPGAAQPAVPVAHVPHIPPVQGNVGSAVGPAVVTGAGEPSGHAIISPGLGQQY